MEQVLASHSQVHGAGELRLVRQTFNAIPAVVGQTGIVPCLAALDAAGVEQLCQRHHQAQRAILDRVRPGFAPDRVVDKMPDNYLHLGLLALMYPRATLIHVRRDPRDIALSCWMTNFRSIPWANHPDHLAGRIRDHRRISAHWQAVLPAQPHEVIYERLIDDFENEAKRLVAACGLEWEPACLQFHQTVRPVRTRERHPGKTAPLQPFGRPLETLRRLARATFRPLAHDHFSPGGMKPGYIPPGRP